MNENSNPWLRSPAWDGFWMLSALWLLVPIALFGPSPDSMQLALIAATLPLWLAHRFATTYNAFCTPAYRTLIRTQARRFFMLPGILFLLVFAFVFLPESLLPLPLLGRILILGTIFYLYNSYHFGMQHYGVLSIYRIRAGQSPQSRFKRYEKFYVLAVGAVLVGIGQLYHGAIVVMDSLIYQLEPPSALLSQFAILRWLAPAVVIGLTALFLYNESREEPGSAPKYLYVIGLAIQGIAAYFLPPVAFLFLWGVQHWLVSVALSAHMAENDSSEIPSASRWYRGWAHVNRRFWRTVGVLAAVSILLTPFFEYALHPGAQSGGPVVAGYLQLLLQNEAILRLVVVLSFWTVFLHFVMDRAVFRFSNAEVRKVTAPLLFKRPAPKAVKPKVAPGAGP